MTIATPIPETAFSVNHEKMKSYNYTKKVGNYLLGRQLGQGSFAKVKEGLHTITGERVAVKIIDQEKCKTDAYVRRNLRKEAKILQQLRHDNIVQLYEIMETQNSYYLVMEYCSGEMMHHILKSKSLSEYEARKYLRQIICAVYYMHQVGVIHRDLKIENLLLGEKDDIKIIDFGLSTMVRTTRRADGQLISQLCRTQCGSPAYAAPEVLAKKAYSIAADTWSVGVNMYAMLVGSLPFTVQPFSIKGLCHKMMSGDINPLPSSVSRNARDLLFRLLTPNPDNRITLKEAMVHPWINEMSPCLGPSPYPNRLKVSDLIPEVTRHMTKNLEFRMGDTVRLLLINSPHQATAVYHLLVRKLRRYCRQRKISWPLRKKGPGPTQFGGTPVDQEQLEDEEEERQIVDRAKEKSNEHLNSDTCKTSTEEERRQYSGVSRTGRRILSRRRPQERRRMSSSDKENEELLEEKKRVTFQEIPPIASRIRAPPRRIILQRQPTVHSPSGGAISALPELLSTPVKTPPQTPQKSRGTRQSSPLKTHLIDARALTVVLPSKRPLHSGFSGGSSGGSGGGGGGTPSNAYMRTEMTPEVQAETPTYRMRPVRKTVESASHRPRFSAPPTQVVRYSLDTRSGTKHLISDTDSNHGGRMAISKS